MASITFREEGREGGDETSARCGKEKCPIKYKNCNNAPTHSQISTEGIPQHAVYPALPSREQGGITATVGGGENSGVVSRWEKKASGNQCHGAFCYFLCMLHEEDLLKKTIQMLKCSSHAAKLKARSSKVAGNTFRFIR